MGVTFMLILLGLACETLVWPLTAQSTVSVDAWLGFRSKFMGRGRVRAEISSTFVKLCKGLCHRVPKP